MSTIHYLIFAVLTSTLISTCCCGKIFSGPGYVTQYEHQKSRFTTEKPAEETCIPNGSICHANWANPNCCSDLCQFQQSNGKYECEGPIYPKPKKTTTKPSCLPIGDQCLSRKDCCSGRCSHNNHGPNYCAPWLAPKK